MHSFLNAAASAKLAKSHSRSKDKMLKLNICGETFKFLKSSLTDHPETLLGKLANMPCENLVKHGLWDAYLEEENEIFFNRPSDLFGAVAQFYQTGRVHNIPGVCPAAMKEELHFWGIYPKYVQSFCDICLKKKNTSTSSSKDEIFGKLVENNSTITSISSTNDGHFVAKAQTSMNNGDVRNEIKKQTLINGGFNVNQESGLIENQIENQQNQSVPESETAREQIWNLLEGTTSNRISLILNFVSILFILLNISLIILDSLPHYHYSEYSNFEIFNISHHKVKPKSSNLTEEEYEFQTMEVIHLNHESILTLYSLDWICSAVFSIEFAIKVWACPNRCLFMRQPMTIVDVLAILPAYVEAIANLMEVHHGGSLSALQVLRIFRAFRVFRIMKLAKYESSFKVLGNCLKDCIPEFILLFMYLFMATLLFGSMLYYAEGEVEGTFYGTIPDAIWWSIVTYFSFADAPPVTLFGKFVAAASSIAGVVLMALPVSVIVDKFANFINDMKRQKELAQDDLMSD